MADSAIGAALDDVLTHAGAHLVLVMLREPLLGELYSRGSPDAELQPMLHAKSRGGALAGAAGRAGGGGMDGGGMGRGGMGGGSGDGGSWGLGTATLLPHERRRRKTFHLAALLDDALIHIGKVVAPDGAHDALVLAVLSAMASALELVLLQAEPRRIFHADDAPRLAADLQLLRDYFVARDETGEVNGLPEDVVDAELSYLHGLVELMAETSEDLLALLFGSAASNYGADGVKRSDGLPEWDAQSPRNRCTVARLLLDRARGGDVVAHRFAEQHKEALREMLARHPSIQVESRHGTKSVGALRERIEAAEAEAEAEEEEEARRAEEAAEAAAAEAAAAAAAAAANPTVTPLVGGGRARSQTTSAMADFFASRPPPSVANRRASDASGMAAMHRQPSQGSKAAGMAKTGQTPPAPPPPVRQFSGHI